MTRPAGRRAAAWPLLAALSALLPMGAAANTLTIAAMTSPGALDPHDPSTNDNTRALRQIFDPLTSEAMRVAVEDKAVIPVFSLRVNRAARKDRLTYDPSPNWDTTALFATPVSR